MGDWERLLWQIVQVVIWVSLGLGFFALAYLIIDKLTPFSFHKEIIEDKNVALAILLAAVFLGIALIVAAAIHG